MLRNALFLVSALLGGCVGAWGGFWLLLWAQYGWQCLTHTLPDDDLVCCVSILLLRRGRIIAAPALIIRLVGAAASQRASAADLPVFDSGECF